jgi:hypothetical protein
MIKIILVARHSWEVDGFRTLVHQRIAGRV